MRPFAFQRVEDAAEAVAGAGAGGARTQSEAPVQFLAGGTTLIDLMKLDVMRPEKLIDINPLSAAHSAITLESGVLRLGALAHMAEVADHPLIRRDFPVIAQSLALAASPQLRNMATLSGNVLQRTRCTYFRDVSWNACNKRNPGSGCAALEGVNRKHAVLGGSAQCIATYPGDFAQSLMALDAAVEILAPSGISVMPFAALHRPPGTTPQVETVLPPAALITAFAIPARPWMRRSLYLKIRDRESFEFALASAAVALDMKDGTVNEARIALGGLATVPWRAREAEAALAGQTLTEARAEDAARIAFAGATPRPANAFRVELGRRTLSRALLQAARMEL